MKAKPMFNCKTEKCMMKKVALPVINNQLSQYFEQCSGFIIFTIKDKSLKKDLLSPHIQPGILPHWLAEQGVTDIITKGIENNSASKLNKFKINVFAGVDLSGPEQLIKEFLNGSLEAKGVMVEN